MNLELIRDALETSLNLLDQEVEIVTLADLKEEYLLAMKKLEKAIKALDKDE